MPSAPFERVTSGARVAAEFPLPDFWGKARLTGDGSLLGWHPLVDHCIDVAVMLRALLNVRGLRRSTESALSSPLSDAQCDRLAVIALLHDIGKANTGFQRKIFGGPPAGHVREVAPLFHDERLQEALLRALPFEALQNWFRQPEQFPQMLVAAISHHGKPEVYGAGDAAVINFAPLWRVAGELDPFAALASLGAAARDAFPLAFADKVGPIDAGPPLQHCFAGLVMLADWLGSHTGFFPFRNDPRQDRAALARLQAARAIEVIGLDGEAARGALASAALSFAGVFGFPPHTVQKFMWEELDPQSPDCQVVLVESETGSGKTEAALGWYLRLFGAGCVDSLYFALPTRVAARELYGRTLQFVLSAFGRDVVGPTVLAVPGYARIDGEPMQFLASPANLWQDDAKAAERERTWAAENPKRFLAAPVAVGTIDQALLSIIQTRHAHLRAGCLARSLLVVDEVHASDPYMRRLLAALLRLHLQRGGYALLLSATLGVSCREQLLHPERRIQEDSNPIADAIAAAYPAITTRGQTFRLLSDAPSKRVRILTPPLIDNLDAAVVAIVAALKAGARVLVVMNTVRRALMMQRAIEKAAVGMADALFSCRSIVCPHHGRFARVDRELLDAAVSARLGRESAAGPVVVVGTQTLEQSLDIDADVLFTDLCPMDVLLQRIGRLHRHADRPRPAEYATAQAYVLSPDEPQMHAYLRDDGRSAGRAGLGSVYPDVRIARATLAMLRSNEEVCIPADNRRLVEGSMHVDVLAQFGEDRWLRHARLIQQDAQVGLYAADTALIKVEVPFNDPRLKFADPSVTIATRLGLGDRRVMIAAAPTGPFGQSIEELIIPAHMVRANEDEEVGSVTATVGVIEFMLGRGRYRYSRFGLELLREPA